jgi:ZIP family zinc transporter
MLAATFVSLLQPAVTYAENRVGSKPQAAAIVMAGLLCGAVALFLAHRYSPHEHFILGREGPQGAKLRRIWLFVIAITLHNFPEGMAVGVGVAGDQVGKGIPLTIGIGLQNVPEGLAVAAALVAVDYPKRLAFWVAALTGLVEPVGGAFGSAAVSFAEPIVPWTLGFAAGAMLFVISDEIIPETHRGGYEDVATFSLLVGFALMILLDATFA